MLILLADDERMVRLGLMSMLEELFENEHTYIHAKNGLEVVELMNKYKPDIAFLDVKMPLMDGLEALMVCKDLSPVTTWIILSGYADFDYARQALSLSAFEYILKPVDIKALKDLFDRIAAKKAVNLAHNNTIFSHDVIRSFNMAEQFPAEEVEFLPDTVSQYVLYQFYIDQQKQSSQHALKQQLDSSINDFCTQNTIIQNHCRFFNTEGNLCLICDVADASRLTHFISLLAKDFKDKAFSIFYGNGQTIKDLYAITKRIAAIEDIRIVADCSRPVLINNIEVLPHLKELILFAGNCTKLLELYLRESIGTYRKTLLSFSEDKEMRATFLLIDTQVLKNYLHDFFEADFNFGSFDELVNEIAQYMENPGKNSILQGGTAIEKIQDFICQNYQHDVSISYVSELFNLSPPYMSKLFHEKTGQKYIDFVTQIRMEKAKQMIQENPSVSVKQVSEAVGYISVRHFSKIFQRYTGKLPSGFLKS